MEPKKIFVGIPVLNRVDLLERCLDHIDHPADIVIVNNNTVDADFDARLTRLAEKRGAQVWRPDRNLGVAASWNLILKLGMGWGYRLVFIGSNDTFLYPGSLRAVATLDAPQEEVIWHLQSFNFFAIHTRAVHRVGWFDENFYPAYKEDQDYCYRCDLAGMRRNWALPAGVGADHLGSQTILSDPEYLVLNEATHFDWNLGYYIRKWGGDWGEERWRTPFDRPDKDWRWWPDPGSSIWQRDWDRERRRREREARDQSQGQRAMQ